MTLMRSGSATLGAAILLGALGCGAGGIAATETDSRSETEEGDGDGESGDGDDGDGDLPADACIEDGQLARALAIVDSTAQQVHVFEPGGGELMLPAPLPEGVDAPAFVHAVTSSGYIAITTSYTIYLGPGSEEGSILRLYDRHSGALLWERSFVDRRLGQVFVDAQGRVVAAHGWSADWQPPGGVMVIDGQITELPNFAPEGPLGAGDWMPGWIVDDTGEHLGSALHQPFAGEWVEVTDSWQTSWRAGDQSIEYVDNDQPVAEFVVARPESSTQIELTPFAGLDGMVHVEGQAGDYRLLSLAGGEGVPPVWVRLQVSTQELLEIELTPPTGLEPFDCYFPRTTVDAAGRILVELRDAGAAQIHAWDPEADVWTAVGVPMTDVEDIGVDGRFGRVELIQAHGAGTTYCLPTEWADPPATAIEGSSVQLARIDPPLSVIIDAIPFTMISVDTSERCATWTDASGQVVRDLDDGDALTLTVSGAALWLD